MFTVAEIIAKLQLEAHPMEGGYYRETYRSTEEIAASALPSRYQGSRSHSTAIYYLLTPEGFSAMHRLSTDEVFHFYLGDPVEMLQLLPDGSGKVIKLGADITAGENPQLVVPRGVWQGSQLIPGGNFALLGATVAPGFDFADYEAGLRDALSESYPDFKHLIGLLTRE
jgi:predicted cupin superfamily sugar epimerase